MEIARNTQRNGQTAAEDPVIRQKLAQCYAEIEIMRFNQMRAFSRINETGVPGPEGSIQKIFWSELNQRFQQMAQEILGPYGQLLAHDPRRVRRRPVGLRLPAHPRQYHRGRHVGNPAKHHRALRARPAEELLRGHAMQFGLSETQQILKNSARKFFAAECPSAEVRRLMETDTAYDAKLWRKWPSKATPASFIPEDVRRHGSG